MNIGIFFTAAKASGGVYQYSLTMLDCLRRYDREHTYYVFYSNPDFPYPDFEDSNWKTIPMNSVGGALQGGIVQRGGTYIVKSVGKAIRLICRFGLIDPYRVRLNRPVYHKLKRYNIDLMIYPAPIAASFEAGIPYIIAIHDLQHRLQPEFPEVSVHGRWRSREYLLGNATKYTLAILVDSETGREDLIKAYNVPPEAVKVLPFLSPHHLTIPNESEREVVKRKYNLPDRYIFYPAQFWSHKNHARLVKALHLIKGKWNIEIPCVFVGSKKGAFEEVMGLVQRLGMQNQVMYLGYVPHEDMAALYSLATALVMPTFFGPTNIPILEAFALSCPVVTSDVRGIREQVGDAGLLVDPRSVQDIATAIYRVWTDDELRQTLIQKAKKRIKDYTRDDYSEILLSIIRECQLKLAKTGVSL